MPGEQTGETGGGRRTQCTGDAVREERQVRKDIGGGGRGESTGLRNRSCDGGRAGAVGAAIKKGRMKGVGLCGFPEPRGSQKGGESSSVGPPNSLGANCRAREVFTSSICDFEGVGGGNGVTSSRGIDE